MRKCVFGSCTNSRAQEQSDPCRSLSANGIIGYYRMNGEQWPRWYSAHVQDDLNLNFAHVRRHVFAWYWPNDAIFITSTAMSALWYRIWSRKSNIQRYILSAEIALTNIFFLFLPKVVTGRWQDWGRLDYTASHKIWVSLISITKWHETSVNKCHEHILLIIFIRGVFIIDLHIYFLYTDIHSLMMLWRTFDETTDRSVLCLHLG